MITPYSKNAKKHPEKQLKLLANSLQRFGWQQPIKVGADGVIIVGHGRWEAYSKYPEGIKEPWIIDETGKTISGAPEDKKLSIPEEKAYRLADNKLNESDWNLEMAIEDLRELDEDLQIATGFDLDILVDPSSDDDAIPATPVNPRTKLGDIYVLGSHHLMCGDSCNLEDVTHLMEGKKADMVWTDPPYNVAYQASNGNKIMNDQMSPEDFKVFVDGFVTNLLTFCRGAIYVCMSSSEWGTVQDSFKRLGGHWSRVIVWVKDRLVLSRADYHTQFEPILVENEDENEDGQPILYGWKDGEKRIWNGDRKQTDIWKVKRPTSNKEHPTMKPVELVMRGILNSSVRDCLVMDLFLGGGSCLIACEKTSRVCYGMELEPKYCDVIVQRYVDFTGNENIILNGQPIVWPKKLEN